jgi:transcriptional regulator with XRE-family HTH domain
VLVRASIACQVGDECPFSTFREMAEHYGVGTEQLRQYVRGERELQPRLAKAFGLEKIVLYAPAKGIEAEGGDACGSVHESPVSEGNSP